MNEHHKGILPLKSVTTSCTSASIRSFVHSFLYWVQWTRTPFVPGVSSRSPDGTVSHLFIPASPPGHRESEFHIMVFIFMSSWSGTSYSLF